MIEGAQKEDIVQLWIGLIFSATLCTPFHCQPVLTCMYNKQ